MGQCEWKILLISASLCRKFCRLGIINSKLAAFLASTLAYQNLDRSSCFAGLDDHLFELVLFDREFSPTVLEKQALNFALRFSMSLRERLSNKQLYT